MWWNWDVGSLAALGCLALLSITGVGAILAFFPGLWAGGHNLRVVGRRRDLVGGGWQETGVAGTLKLYLRDLTESLVTTPIYLKMFEAFSNIPSHESEAKKNALLGFFSQVPHNPNQACVVFLIEHIVKVSQYEQQNKMSLLYEHS